MHVNLTFLENNIINACEVSVDHSVHFIKSHFFIVISSRRYWKNLFQKKKRKFGELFSLGRKIITDVIEDDDKETYNKVLEFFSINSIITLILILWKFKLLLLKFQKVGLKENQDNSDDYPSSD